ncbi:MAG: hypothetical protein JXB49_10260 [Bacteroidales bacterium]|nr:hypothetical protein [Bacteroidales bacterium]
MKTDENNSLFKQQSENFVDIHCHCLPCMDDGPPNEYESILLCKALIEQGITTVVATPHQLGRFENQNKSSLVRESVNKLNEIIENTELMIKILPGSEVRVDERICKLLDNDEILTIADRGRYILLELPHEIFINIEQLIKDLYAMDIIPVISHAERYPGLVQNTGVLFNWCKYPVCLQVNASSLFGDFGFEAEKAAWNFLTSGLEVIIATDSHNTSSRKPKMRDAYNLIASKLGYTYAAQVCIKKPLQIISETTDTTLLSGNNYKSHIYD